MPLYRVDVKTVVYVVADDRARAEFIAEDAVTSNGGDGLVLRSLAFPVDPNDRIPNDWAHSLPFSDDDVPEKTVAEWQKEMG
jgi:hypothetical protein